MKQLLCIGFLIAAAVAQAQKKQSPYDYKYAYIKLPTGDLSLVQKKGAYVFQDSVYYTNTINHRTLSFGADGIAYEAFDMAEYPTNETMSKNFWGMKYCYRIEGNNISIEHVNKWSDGRLHCNYEYGTIENGRIVLTHGSSDGSKRRRPLARIKVYIYDDNLTAKPAWQ